jgi:hypothetical protein
MAMLGTYRDSELSRSQGAVQLRPRKHQELHTAGLSSLTSDNSGPVTRFTFAKSLAKGFTPVPWRPARTSGYRAGT